MDHAGAINVFTLILAGLGLALGLLGPSNPLLSMVPAAVGAVVVVLFLLLPRHVERIVRQVPPGRLPRFDRNGSQRTGGIGVRDGSMIGMLVLYGAGGTVATAATLAYHAISLWVPALWGTIAFIMLQRTKRQPIILRNPPEQLRGSG